MLLMSASAGCASKREHSETQSGLFVLVTDVLPLVWLVQAGVTGILGGIACNRPYRQLAGSPKGQNGGKSWLIPVEASRERSRRHTVM